MFGSVVVLAVLLLRPQAGAGDMITVTDLARAIARAEGYYAPGSRAMRSNNPGNIFYSGVYQTFATIEAGWKALEGPISSAIRGGIYSSKRTWREFAWYYVNGTAPDAAVIHASDAANGGPDQWLRNVSAALGVQLDPNSDWRSMIEAKQAPAVSFAPAMFKIPVPDYSPARFFHPELGELIPQ